MSQEDKPSANTLETSTRQAGGTDPVLEYMRKMSMPMNRETYLELNYPDGIPTMSPAELEDELPEMFRQPIALSSPVQANLSAEPQPDLCEDEEVYRPSREEIEAGLRVAEVLRARSDAEKSSSPVQSQREKMLAGPTRADFDDEESYQEALSGWRHRIGRVLALGKQMEARLAGKQKDEK